MTDDLNDNPGGKTIVTPARSIRLLQSVPILADLDSEELLALADLAKPVVFRKNDRIFTEGSYGDEVFLLLSGTVKVTTTEPHRKTKILGILNEGDTLGEMAIIDPEYRSATAYAHEHTEALKITRPDFIGFMNGRPNLMLKVMKTLCRRLREANDEIRNYTFYDLSGRLANVILSLYRKFPGERDGVPVIELELTHQDLADMLGTARESVTKLIGSFKKNGSIDYRDQIIFVTDLDELTTWVR